MRRMIRFGVLISVVAFVAACNAPGPTGMGQITSSDPYETVSGDVTAMMPPGCSNIVHVDVLMLPATSVEVVRFQARYRYSAPVERCMKGPRWEASRAGIVVDPKNRFLAWIPRNPLQERTVVTATAPNRVKGTVTF